METTFTLRNPPYTYLHLQVIANIPSTNKPSFQSQPPPDLDSITLVSHLTSALNQYLGLTGTAIPIDILKVSDNEGWVRLPSDDESAVVAALSQWTGKRGVTVRVLGRGSWLGGLLPGGGVGELQSIER